MELKNTGLKARNGAYFYLLSDGASKRGLLVHVRPVEQVSAGPMLVTCLDTCCCDIDVLQQLRLQLQGITLNNPELKIERVTP